MRITFHSLIRKSADHTENKKIEQQLLSRHSSNMDWQRDNLLLNNNDATKTPAKEEQV